MKKYLAIILALIFGAGTLMAQERDLTRDEILNMSIEELSDLDLDQLMKAVETLGVSSVDELFAMIMNKNVSSASKSEESSFTSPLSTTVITREELRSWGVTCIEEAFRLVPGMIVTEKTNGVYDVQVRGLNNVPDRGMLLYTENSNTLLMIDGRICHSYAQGAFNSEALPIGIEDIQRIEVVRGACSALYGQNAVNGVINIITEKPSVASKAVSGSFQMGNNNTYIGDIALRKAFGTKLALGISANMQYRQRPTNKLYIIPGQDDLYLLEDDGTYTSVADGGYYTVNEVSNMYTSTDGSTYYDATESTTPIESMFPTPEISRRNEGYNGYISFTPTEKLRFDLTGGYQRSYVNATPVNSDIFAFNGREIKNGYLNLLANVYGLSLTANYLVGPQNYAVGVPGFKVKNQTFAVGAEYDFELGDLHIRPGVSYQMVKGEDYTPYDVLDSNGDHLWGFFGYEEGSAKLEDFSPSIRLDYKIGDFRVIGAYRAEKTSIPDKWNHSWQLAANYDINDNNFVRIVYGRAFRSAIFTNTSSNYVWNRDGMQTPSKIQFVGNEDADLMHIDNVDLGYRWKPTKKILLDAEAFFSYSTDYGQLQSYSSMVTADYSSLGVMLANISSFVDMIDYTSEEDMTTTLSGVLNKYMSTMMRIKYTQVPAKVYQYGLSLNLDWIVSPKLIVKVNANVQKTTIDNYCTNYSQSSDVATQLSESYSNFYSHVGELLTEIQDGIETYGQEEYLADMIGATNSWQYAKEVYYSLDEAGQEAYLESLLEAYDKGTTLDGIDYPLRVYYSLKYGVGYDQSTSQFYMGSSDQVSREYKNGHHHKATPSVYGMVGVICKPIEKLNISAFANYIGRREYYTMYNLDTPAKLGDRFTMNLKVGYKPEENFEVFFNAHNLFNTEKREFIYADKIGGIYTVGVNFTF